MTAEQMEFHMDREDFHSCPNLLLLGHFGHQHAPDQTSVSSSTKWREYTGVSSSMVMFHNDVQELLPTGVGMKTAHC